MKRQSMCVIEPLFAHGAPSVFLGWCARRVLFVRRLSLHCGVRDLCAAVSDLCIRRSVCCACGWKEGVPYVLRVVSANLLWLVV